MAVTVGMRSWNAAAVPGTVGGVGEIERIVTMMGADNCLPAEYEAKLHVVDVLAAVDLLQLPSLAVQVSLLPVLPGLTYNDCRVSPSIRKTLSAS